MTGADSNVLPGMTADANVVSQKFPNVY